MRTKTTKDAEPPRYTLRFDGYDPVELDGFDAMGPTERVMAIGDAVALRMGASAGLTYFVMQHMALCQGTPALAEAAKRAWPMARCELVLRWAALGYVYNDDDRELVAAEEEAAAAHKACGNCDPDGEPS